jgi:hypothetical protein
VGIAVALLLVVLLQAWPGRGEGQAPRGKPHADEAAAPQRWLPASPQKLPRWRGFNLLEKFTAGPPRRPFHEEDFRLIAQLGFNFVRLPMDYRCWLKDPGGDDFDEAALRQIDQAVDWGRRHGLHVCLNFHRAPGYTVARPPEKTSLWDDATTQRRCARHWALFARRYRGIPAERLSFNLLNEPGDVAPEVYAAVVRQLVEAIRAEDPGRLILCDGLHYGNAPVPELLPLRVAQATRGYSPFELTHYRASWANGDRFPLPRWPTPVPPGGVLMGPARKADSVPLVLDGPFTAATQLRLHVRTVSDRATLRVEGDGNQLWQHEFVCGPGAGEWKEAHYRPEWKIYQNLYDRTYHIQVPAGTRQVQVRVTAGDWLEVAELGCRPDQAGAAETVLALSTRWKQKPQPLRYAPGAPGGPFLGVKVEDRAWLWTHDIVPWKDLEARGSGVMVGEWGAYNKTPHDVVLRWAEDCVSNWQKAGWGWALWNFRGPFGILDSDRADVSYEELAGHRLDRQFLRLLQRY